MLSGTAFRVLAGLAAPSQEGGAGSRLPRRCCPGVVADLPAKRVADNAAVSRSGQPALPVGAAWHCRDTRPDGLMAGGERRVPRLLTAAAGARGGGTHMSGVAREAGTASYERNLIVARRTWAESRQIRSSFDAGSDG